MIDQCWFILCLSLAAWISDAVISVYCNIQITRRKDEKMNKKKKKKEEEEEEEKEEEEEEEK